MWVTDTSLFLAALQHLELRTDVTACPGIPWMIYRVLLELSCACESPGGWLECRFWFSMSEVRLSVCISTSSQVIPRLLITDHTLRAWGLLSKIKWPQIHGFTSGFCVQFHWSICQSLHQHMALLLWFYIQNCKLSNSAPFSIVLANSVSFAFLYTFYGQIANAPPKSVHVLCYYYYYF